MIAVKSKPVYVLTCDVCGAALDYDGNGYPAGWCDVTVPGASFLRAQVCPKDAELPYTELVKRLAAPAAVAAADEPATAAVP